MRMYREELNNSVGCERENIRKKKKRELAVFPFLSFRILCHFPRFPFLSQHTQQLTTLSALFSNVLSSRRPIPLKTQCRYIIILQLSAKEIHPKLRKRKFLALIYFLTHVVCLSSPWRPKYTGAKIYTVMRVCIYCW